VIDRKTALRCAALIVLMLVMAVWRISTLERWTIEFQNGAATTLPSLRPLIFPACSAFLVGVLYRAGLRAKADAAVLEPWRKWGAFVSIGYCGCLLLTQVVIIIRSLKPDLPLYPSAIGRTLGILIAIMSLLAINQIPKLPYFERRSAPGGDLGPIYGPRYTRTISRILALFMIVAIAYFLVATPAMAWRATLLFLLATAFFMVCSIAWRLHLGRKWKRQQLGERRLA
jgi:hypothetical protein